MIKRTLLFCALIASLSSLAQEVKGIRFEHGTWAEALAKAKKEKKMIMLDAYASWCGPCKWMAKSIFTQQNVGEFYNKNFVNVKIDMEKGEGIELAKKYGVTAYPTFFYIDGDGNMVHRKCGGQEAEDFIQSGKDAMDPAKQLSVIQKNFESDRKIPEKALKYFEEAEKACVDLEEPVKKYLDELKPESYLEKSNFALIDKFVNDPSHKAIGYILTNYEKATAAVGKEQVDMKVKNIYSDQIIMAAKKKDEKQLKDVQADYRARKNVPVEYLDLYSDLTWSSVVQDTAAFIKATIAFTEKYLMDDANALNNHSWNIYLSTDDKAHLEKAAGWAKRSVELEPTYANTDTYAAILMKLEKYADAKIWLEKSIEYAKQDGIDTSPSEKMLQELNKKLGK